MDKNAKRGLLSLLLWAGFLTLLAFVFFGEKQGSPGGILRILSYAVPLLCAGFYILVFLALKQSRLRMLLFLAVLGQRFWSPHGCRFEPGAFPKGGDLRCEMGRFR